MRKIRNAAVVGLAAFSLMAGTISAASAAENTAPKKDDMSASASLSSEKKDEKADMDKDKKDEGAFDALSSDKDDKDDQKSEVTGRNFLGWDRNFTDQPVWAQVWYVATVLGIVGSVLGVVALPVLNQAKAQGLIV